MHENIGATKVLGLESRAAWRAPGEYLQLDCNLTFQDVRNVSDQGRFAYFRGDRIPNRPYLFGTGSARIQVRELIVDEDRLWLTFTTRYVAPFDRSWKSAGANEVTIPRP